MKKNSAFLYITFIAALFFSGCKKYEFDKEQKGESIVTAGFRLTAPLNNTTVVLNSATPNTPVVITWGEAKPAVNAPVTYKWVAVGKIGDINNPLLSIPSDNAGKATKLTLTYKAIIDVLKSKGLPLPNTPVFKLDMIWSVLAENGATSTRCEDVFNISFSVNPEGASPFVLLGPVSSTKDTTINPSLTGDLFKFNWTRSKPANPANPVKYKVWFAGEGQIASPKFSVNSNNNGADSLLTISNKDLSDSLVKYGFPVSEIAKLQWTVTASSGAAAPLIFTQFADFPNTLYLKREQNLFLVGGDCPIGWTPTSALQFIEDNANSGVFYIYTYLTPGNFGLKFLALKADWGAVGQTVYGGSNGSASGNNPAENTGVFNAGGGNIATPGVAGVYRIQAKLSTGEYNIKPIGVGLVGGVNGWNPNGPIYMKYLTTNRFMLLQDFTTGNEEFKFHDGADGWNSGYGQSNYFGAIGGQPYNGAGSKLTKPGDNVFQNGTKPAAGRWRCIWDGTDTKNLRYAVSAPGELYMIGGDANIGNWDNSAGNANIPKFTYLGNGQWSLTVTVSSGAFFKLIMEKGNWDLQWGKGSAPGTMKMRFFDADPDAFNFPAAGTYTVLVDEYAGTISGF
jgi:starch-binding outer membrane protein SusE/F